MQIIRRILNLNVRCIHWSVQGENSVWYWDAWKISDWKSRSSLPRIAIFKLFAVKYQLTWLSKSYLSLISIIYIDSLDLNLKVHPFSYIQGLIYQVLIVTMIGRDNFTHKSSSTSVMNFKSSLLIVIVLNRKNASTESAFLTFDKPHVDWVST